MTSCHQFNRELDDVMTVEIWLEQVMGGMCTRKLTSAWMGIILSNGCYMHDPVI